MVRFVSISDRTPWIERTENHENPHFNNNFLPWTVQ